jgi:hypothetical protein
MSGTSDWISRNGDNILLTAVSIAIGVFFSWFFFWRQKQPKTLDWAIVSSVDLTPDPGAGVPNELRVTWTGKTPWPDRDPDIKPFELNRGRMVIVRIQNTGKKELAAEDFVEPIRVYSDSNWIIAAIVIRMSRDGIVPRGVIEAAPDPHSRALTPRLMNPLDWIEIQLIMSKADYYWSEQEMATMPEERRTAIFRTVGAPADHLQVAAWLRGETRPMHQRQEMLNTPLRTIIRSRLRSFVRRDPVAWWSILGIVAALASLIVAAITLVPLP